MLCRPACRAFHVVTALVASALVQLPSPLPAAPLEKLTIERIHSDPPLAGELPQRLLWHPDGKRLTFLRKQGEAERLCALDVSRGNERVLVDGSKLQAPDPRIAPGT